MKLYELANDFLEVENLEGVDAQTQNEILNAIKVEIENKGDGIIKFIRNEEASLKVIDEEIKRLQAIKKTKNNKIKNIKDYVHHCMTTMGSKKIEGNIGRISIRKNPVALNIIDESLIPEKFIGEEVIKTINKAMIKDLLKDGEKISGCELTQSESVIIR